MASAPHVLRVALAHAAEGPSSHVLVAVSPSKQASPASLASQSLDLELLATDDQKAYVMTRKLPHGATPMPAIRSSQPRSSSSVQLHPGLSIWPREPALAARQPY